MKIDSKNLTVFPRARYIVTQSGVKMMGGMPKNLYVLNISRQKSQYDLINIIMKYGLGKQYV